MQVVNDDNEYNDNFKIVKIQKYTAAYRHRRIYKKAQNRNKDEWVEIAIHKLVVIKHYKRYFGAHWSH